MAHPPTNPKPLNGRAARLAALVLGVAFLAITWPIILSGNLNGRGAFDQINYHELVIREFARNWPRPDLSDYLSATTPGYHLILAGFVRLGIDSATALQLIGSLFGVGLVATLAAWCARRAGMWIALLCCAPLAVSLYVVSSGVWLLPDNIGWWLAVATMLVALRPRFDASVLALGGILLLLLVLARQSHLWAAAVIWAAAWLGDEQPETDRPRGELAYLFADPAPRMGRTLAALLVSLPAFAAVWWFWQLWGNGLVPPQFQGMYSGTSPSAPVIELSLLGVFGLFFVGYWWGSLVRLWGERRWVLVTGTGAGLALALIPETTFDIDAGRFSGLWNVANRLPVLFGRTSPLFMVLGVLGAVVLVAWAAAMPRRARWILLGSLGAFTAAQAASPNIWQRYNEPFILIVCALMGTLAAAHEKSEPSRFMRVARRAGPLTLAVGFAFLLAVVLYRDPPADRVPHTPVPVKHGERDEPTGR